MSEDIKQKAEERAAKLIDELADGYGETIMRMDGFDDCVAGFVERCGHPPILCYDVEKVIAKLESQGMTREEAEEFFAYNQLGAWVGEGTPCFLQRLSLEEDGS